MSKNAKKLARVGIILIVCVSIIGMAIVSIYAISTINSAHVQENQTYMEPIELIGVNPDNLSRNDVFASNDFSPLLTQSEFTQHDILHYDEIVFPNYLTIAQKNDNPIQPNNTMLYIAHKNAYGESFYVVYGFSYGFESIHDEYPNSIEDIRSLYFRHLQKLLEAVMVEELKVSVEAVFKNVFSELRTYIDEEMHTNGINMYLSQFQIAPLFDLFSNYPNNQWVSSLPFIIFKIENGISRPAATVTLIDDTTALIEDEDIEIIFSGGIN